MLYLYNYLKLIYTQTNKLILIDSFVFYEISKQSAGLRSSFYHCRFFFFNRGYVIKCSIYARQYDIPPGQFIEHPRGYFYMNVTWVKIRNIENCSGRPRSIIFPFFGMTNDRTNLVKFDKSHRWNFEKCLVKTFT